MLYIYMYMYYVYTVTQQLSGSEGTERTQERGRSDQQTSEGGGERGADKERDTCTIPNTAHAVLGEGSLECLALSKTGLFAAGKVSLMPRTELCAAFDAQ